MEHLFWTTAVLLWLQLALPRVSGNLVTNGDFEFPVSSGDWTCSGCRLQLSPDSYSGSHSGHVTNRHDGRSGATQTIAVQAGKSYFLRGFTKLLFNAHSAPYHGVTVKADLGKDDHGHHQEIYISMMNFLQNGIWAEIGGDFTVPDYVHGTIRLFLIIDQADVDYLIDNMTVEEIPILTNFKAEADARIDQIRKQDVHIHVSGEGSISSDTVVELKQLKHAFIMGAMVEPEQFMDPKYKPYQDTFFSHFNYGTIGNGIKWKQMESVRGYVDYHTPDAAVDYIRSRGLKVRAHNIFWSGQSHIPDWVLHLHGDQLKSAMMDRINQSAGHFKGRVSEWDVSNENIHLDWYEQQLQDPNITQWMFRETHKADPNARLFLNDFRVVSDGRYTAALLNQAMMLKGAGLPLYGVSPQSHMKFGVDVTLMKHRLDELSRAGLPIWISELDIPYKNDSERAQKLEEALRLFFSHPSVMGVTLWGFWDGMKDTEAEKALFNGPQLTPNEAGRRFESLWQHEWTTHVTQPLSHGQTQVRGFKGDYSVHVLHKGQLLKEQNFTLGDSPVDVHIHVTSSGMTFRYLQKSGRARVDQFLTGIVGAAYVFLGNYSNSVLVHGRNLELIALQSANVVLTGGNLHVPNIVVG